jgi:hypothetical protein
MAGRGRGRSEQARRPRRLFYFPAKPAPPRIAMRPPIHRGRRAAGGECRSCAGRDHCRRTNPWRNGRRIAVRKAPSSTRCATRRAASRTSRPTSGRMLPISAQGQGREITGPRLPAPLRRVRSPATAMGDHPCITAARPHAAPLLRRLPGMRSFTSENTAAAVQRTKWLPQVTRAEKCSGNSRK